MIRQGAILTKEQGGCSQALDMHRLILAYLVAAGLMGVNMGGRPVHDLNC
jgi:hypothetical protein